MTASVQDGPDLEDLADIDELAPLLATAQASGRVMLAVVDEAEMLAVGWMAPGRTSLGRFAAESSTASAVLTAAGRRLLDRGLTRQRPGLPPGILAPAGGLRDYLSLVCRNSAATFAFGTYLQREDGPTTRILHRSSTLRAPGLVVTEHVLLPVPNDPTSPLPVTLALTTVPLLVDAWVAEAYRDPATDTDRAAAPGTTAGLLGGAGRRTLSTSKLVHGWGEERAVLHWQSRTLLTRRPPGERVGFQPATYRRVSREKYAGHVRYRLSWKPRRPEDRPRV